MVYRPRVTLKDVADLVGVNPSTISRVINNDPNLSIREETKIKILQAVRELGYRPNTAARNLRMKSSSAVGLLVPDISNPFFPEIIKGVENAALEKGLGLFVCNTFDETNREIELLKFLVDRHVDGILIASAHLEDERIGEMRNSGIPYVLVNRRNRTGTGPYVVVDNFSGAKMAVQHLIDLGHTKIAHISGLLYTDTGLERLEGYRNVLNMNHIPFISEYMVEAGFNEEQGYSAMLKLLSLQDPPTAVFAANDLLAMGALLALNEKGWSVPDDISIVGFDDIWVVERITPPLTTVKVPLFEMGYLALNILYKELNDIYTEQEHVLLQPSLVVRRSTRTLIDSILI